MESLKNILATGQAVGKTTGDSIKITFTVTDTGLICGAGFKAYGCEEITEVCDTVIEMISDRGIDYALTLKEENITENLPIVNEKTKMCASIAIDAVKNAIGDYYTNIGLFPKEENHCCCCSECKSE